jgi:hypothetical protein
MQQKAWCVFKRFFLSLKNTLAYLNASVVPSCQIVVRPPILNRLDTRKTELGPNDRFELKILATAENEKKKSNFFLAGGRENPTFRIVQVYRE